MSYNTRRTGTTGNVGRGTTTQVNYHQQPSRPGYNTTQASTKYNAANQPLYSTPQPGYTSATSQQTQAAKNTAAAPPPAPVAPAPAPPLPTTTSPQPKPPQPANQTPSTPKPPVKEEPVTPATTPQIENEKTSGENGEEVKNKPLWKKRPYVKVTNRVKRLRQNAKLRRVLNPKNALTFLNELKPGGVKFVQEKVGWGFTVSVDIDDKTFSGQGLTVSKAKLQASEQALRYILLDKMAKSQTLTSTSSEKEDVEKEDGAEEPMETEQNDGEEGGDETKVKKRKSEIVEDEMPWGSLAAYALHKLLEEWQKEGEATPPAHPVPPPPQVRYDEDIKEELFHRRPRPQPQDFPYPPRNPPMFGRGRGFPFHPRGAPFGGPKRFPYPAGGSYQQKSAIKLGNNQSPASVMPMRNIPEDANKRNPVMLLNQLKPHIIYSEARDPATNLFKITANLDGKEYVGTGKNKKEAKKFAAIEALAPMGIVYEGI